MGGMVLQNAGYPGGGGPTPIAFLRWPGTAHPAAQRTPAPPRRRGGDCLHTAAGGNEVMGAAVPAVPVVKRDTPAVLVRGPWFADSL